MNSVKAIIDLQALVSNIKILKSIAKHSRIVAVIKANAYGHGLISVANALSDYVDAFAVARIDEAISLRNNEISKRIILLEGFNESNDIPLIIENDLDVTVHSFRIMDLIENSGIKHPLRCWLKLDTGMHRLGVNSNEAELLYLRMNRSLAIQKPYGLLSHLCTADDQEKNDFTLHQINTFSKFSQSHPELLTCLGNSAGILEWDDARTDFVRAGIIMYGISPFPSKTGTDLGFKPVMTLISYLIAIRSVRRGERLGYGIAYEATKDTIIGIVGIGYGDGFPRLVSNDTQVLINNRLVNVVGVVCMDMLYVDLGNNSSDNVGDEVVLWGKDLPVELLARKTKTIPYELVAKLTNRVSYVYNS